MKSVNYRTTSFSNRIRTDFCRMLSDEYRMDSFISRMNTDFHIFYFNNEKIQLRECNMKYKEKIIFIKPLKQLYIYDKKSD